MPGKASNAALQDDEDTMVRMKKKRDIWKRLARRIQSSKGLQYPNSPEPPMHSAMKNPRSVATKD